MKTFKTFWWKNADWIVVQWIGPWWCNKIHSKTIKYKHKKTSGEGYFWRAFFALTLPHHQSSGFSREGWMGFVEERCKRYQLHLTPLTTRVECSQLPYMRSCCTSSSQIRKKNVDDIKCIGHYTGNWDFLFYKYPLTTRVHCSNSLEETR